MDVETPDNYTSNSLKELFWQAERNSTRIYRTNLAMKLGLVSIVQREFPNLSKVRRPKLGHASLSDSSVEG